MYPRGMQFYGQNGYFYHSCPPDLQSMPQRLWASNLMGHLRADGPTSNPLPVILNIIFLCKLLPPQSFPGASIPDVSSHNLSVQGCWTYPSSNTDKFFSASSKGHLTPSAETLRIRFPFSSLTSLSHPSRTRVRIIW